MEKFNPEEWLAQEPAPYTKKYAQNPDSQDDIELIVQRIEASSTDITAGYDNWRDIGFALSSELGESGRDPFHRVSRFNPGYNEAECDRQYDKCLRAHGTGVTVIPENKLSEAGAALAVLGYSQGEINLALKGIDLDSLTLEQIIKQALKKMMKG